MKERGIGRGRAWAAQAQPEQVERVAAAVRWLDDYRQAQEADRARAGRPSAGMDGAVAVMFLCKWAGSTPEHRDVGPAHRIDLSGVVPGKDERDAFVAEWLGADAWSLEETDLVDLVAGFIEGAAAVQFEQSMSG